MIDKEKSGFLRFEDFLNALKMVRYSKVTNKDSFKKEFSSLLKSYPNELLDKTDDVVRFGVFKNIFLERNL